MLPLANNPFDAGGGRAVACILHDSNENLPPRVYVCGLEAFEFGESYFDLLGDGGDIIQASSACFCQKSGSSVAFSIFSRKLDSSSYGAFVKFDPSVLCIPFTSPMELSPEYNISNYIGRTIVTPYHATKIQIKAYHDGRAIWVIDTLAGVAKRITAPESRAY
jgi:hypothetical protein